MNKTSSVYYPADDREKLFLNCIWKVSERDLQERKEIILPKGTVEIIFNFSDPVRYSNPALKTAAVLPQVFINGINFKPFELLKTGNQNFLGIQINAIGLRLLFNISAKELNDCVCEGKDVCAQLTSLSERLFFEQSFSGQAEIILAWIRRRFPELNSSYRIDRVRKLLSKSVGDNLSPKKLSEEICLSDRQLRRFCMDWFGMNTVNFVRYNKYLAGLQLLHDSARSLSEIGLEAGYYDQSHFIHEFKSYTNLTPAQYRKANKELPGHILI